MTTSATSEPSTQPAETEKTNLPNKSEPILFVDKAIETSINDNQSAGNTSKDIHSVNIGKVSDVKLGEEKHLEEEDIEELAGRISEILSESGNKEQYEVVVEDISDDEKGDRKEGKIKTGTSSLSHKDSADGPSGASFIEKSVAILSSLSPNSGNKTCSGLKVNNETERPSKIVTENEITVNENTEPNNAFGETEDLHNAVRENTDLDNKTADEIEASLDLSGAGLEIEETDDREKSYLECMEVEDISPPLSLGAEPASNTDTNDTVGNSSETCNSGSTIPSDFKMKSGTYHNIFTLLEKNRSETSVDSLPINEGGDASLSPLNVKENSNTLEADQDKALQTDLIDKESDLIDKESQDLHLVLEDDNNSCSEGMEDTLKNVADSKDRNSFVDYITSSGPHSDVEEADNRAESPENEEKERSDSQMQANCNSISGIAVQQDKVKAGSHGSVESLSIDGLPATVCGSVVYQQTGREQSDDERKENPPPGVETGNMQKR